MTRHILNFSLSLALILTGCNDISGQANLIPFLIETPQIDGNLEEWKAFAHHDGEWDLERVKAADWYHPKHNKLLIGANEDTTMVDLKSSYYTAWDGTFFYFGAEVKDNINDVVEQKHKPKRWYYKDAIAWFMEMPSDTISEKFGVGDHAFAFIADTSMPDYGAWWRHGSNSENYIEEAIPRQSVEYAIEIQTKKGEYAGYVLEARVNMSDLIDDWGVVRDDIVENGIAMMIVHCDPDGEEYGGHLLIYGKGDDDATWTPFNLEAE